MDTYGNVYDDLLPARYRVYLYLQSSSDDGSSRVYAQLSNYDAAEQAYK